MYFLLFGGLLVILGFTITTPLTKPINRLKGIKRAAKGQLNRRRRRKVRR